MGESPDGIQQLNSYVVVSARDSSMRTKVEKSCKKAPQQKLNFNLASPKVVLNADDCARFLDNMGKSSLLLAEKEDKTLADATSEPSSAQPTTSSTSLLSLTAPQPPCSLPTSSSPSTSLTIPCSPASSLSPSQNFLAAPGAASQPQICRNWNTTESTETTEHVETGHAEQQKAADMNGNNSNHQVVSTQTPSILKPPKKRRGHEKKLEEITHSSPIFNNGDVHPPIPTSRELGDSDSFQGSKDPSSLNLSLDVSRKHSVHSLLQHQLEPLAFVKNCPAQTPDFHPHDSRSYPLAQIDLPLSSLTAASCVMSPASLSSSDTSNALSSVPQPQLLTHLYTSGLLLKNEPCSEEMIPALSLPLPVPVNMITPQPGSFQHLPEQLEPMNLSTSCNLDAGPPILQASSSLEQPAPENVSSASPPHLLVAHDTGDYSTTNSDHSSDISKQKFVEKITLLETAEPAYSSCAASMQTAATHSLHNGLSNCISEREAFQATISSKPLSSMDESSRTSFTVSKDATHEAPISTNPVTDLADSKATSVVEVSSQSPPAELSSQTPHLESVTDTCLQSVQESTTVEDIAVTNVRIKIPNPAGTEIMLKVKRPPKKRVEIPMDEVSCADRLHRYSLTVDDVVANFVYIPEPAEDEFCLTKEEAAIIAHSENVYDCCISDLTDICTNNNKLMDPLALGAENQPGAQNGHHKPHVHAEIASIVKPIKKRPAVLEHNQASSCDQDVQKVVENISSVIAFVAGNCSDSLSSLNDGCSESLNVKSKKKVVKKAVDVVKNKEGIQRKRLKAGINNVLPSDKELDTSAGEDQERKGKTDAGMLKEESEKVIKAKKRKSSIKAVDKTNPTLQHTTEAGGVAKEDTMKSVTKKLVKKAKTPKGKKISNEQSNLCVDSVNHSAHAGDKEAASSNRAETSDIGESIASTSGGSEQDTPVHEPESKDDMASTDPQTTDRENHDTGLESGGDDKPVRRYKRRLDFVKCEQCEHRARGRSALSRHMKKVHKVDVNMPFKCEHCGYGCTKMASLNRHLFTHGVYPCSRCSFVANERIRLVEHTIDQHKDKLDVRMCKICNRYIKCNMVTIEQHIQECKGPAPFRCTECEKEFKYASSLRVHYHSHFPDQPKKFECEFCEYRTNYKANLHKHHKNMHASKDRDVQCPECGKLFSAEDNMRRHRKVHTLIRPFSCQTCEKTFKTPAALKGHQLIHNAIRPYTCDIPGCNRNFRTAKFLKSHQEEYHRLVPKKFFCSVEGCSYSFFKRSHLKRHAITHTGERNFHCTWPGCNKSFRHADNLKVHFRSHTNEKPVQCHLCDFKCKQKNSLFWHKKRVHQIVDVSACPGRGYKLKIPMVYDAPSKTPTAYDAPSKTPTAYNATSETVDGEKMDDGKDKNAKECQENEAKSIHIHIKSPMMETSMKTLNEDESDVKTNAATIFSKESKIEKQEKDAVEKKPELSHSSVIGQIVTEVLTTNQDQEGLGPHDLYEFKSEDESEEEKPGNFRRDKALMNVLAPLPPPPKELLRKNEIQEMKEKEKKEKEERKEQEKKEKAERKEQKLKEKAERKSLEKIAKAERKSLEKKEKLEKKELEKKEKVEKKEIEKKEKIEKKEQEKKEKAEQKEHERKEKLERKEVEKQEKIEKKQQEKKEKAEKKQQEKKEIIEKREREKQEKAEKKLVERKSLKEKKNEQETNTSGDENIKNEKPLSKSLVKSLKRRKSAASPVKVDSSAFAQKPKRSRRKLQEDQPEQPSDSEPLSFRSRKDKELSASFLKRRMVSPTKVGEASQTSATTSSALSTRSVANRSPVIRKSVIVRGKKKGKLTPPKRKPSARIKAKKKAKALKAKALGKVKKASSSGFKRKYLRRKAVETVSEAEKAEEEAVEEDSAEVNLDDHSVKNVEENHIDSSGENEVALKSDQVETSVVPQRSSSPAGSDDVMLQGKASPYRDFSEDENPEEEEEEAEKPTSLFLKEEQMKSPLAEDRSEAEADLMLDEKTTGCVVDKHAVHPVEEYSDDEVSNDIPLTPPRAPAPPPVESSEDEMEPEPEPTPISVLGPNTPFSVPGPNTPFSVPPPTNLMQQHSVHSEEAPMSVVPSVPSMEMHSQSSVDMPQPVGSVEMHPHGSVEMHPHGSVEMNCHSQGSVEMSHQHAMVEMRSHNSVEIRSHGSVEMMQSHGSVEMPHHGSISESVHNSEHGVKSPASVIRDMTDKFEIPQSFQEQAQASDADKEYFDQYLKSWNNNRAANGCLDSSLTGLQHLEAMVSKSHHDSREISSKSPISSLPTSVITSLESTLPLLTHGELRARMDALVSDRHRESLYTRDTPSSLARLQDRQTPLPPSAAGHSPAFDAFTSLNPLHSAAAGSGRENSYLRQPENLFPTPPGSSSFMAEAMFQRQTMTTPFLPPQPSDRTSMSRMPDTTPLRSGSSSSLLRRPGTVHNSDMFSPPSMAQTMPRHPFANAWASQEVRPAHWQTPYLPHQSSMAAAGSFFPPKDTYLTGREFMFDPSVRPATERSMFSSLPSSQSQDSFQLDRFDLSNYFPNAMTPYGSSSSSLEYSRSAHTAAAKPFDDRYRQTTSASIHDFRGLPHTGASTDMFPTLPGVNTSFNLYPGNPMSYHTQHMSDNVNTAFLAHPGSAQHPMFDRDYAAAAAHRGLYPQNSPYPFIDERQYPGASKLGHGHAVAPTPVSQERELMSRSAAAESQMQDPYRSMLYRY